MIRNIVVIGTCSLHSIFPIRGPSLTSDMALVAANPDQKCQGMNVTEKRVLCCPLFSIDLLKTDALAIVQTPFGDPSLSFLESGELEPHSPPLCKRNQFTVRRFLKDDFPTGFV